MAPLKTVWSNTTTVGIVEIRNSAIENGDSVCIAQKAFIGTIHRDESVVLTRDEAIAAASAILKHYDIDWNAYGENMQDRYRAPTPKELAKYLAELAKYLADNPHMKMVDPIHVDPDAPITSELQWK